MKNLDQPASPTDFQPQDCGFIGIDSNAFALCEFNRGLTKRERACIDLRIPESGDAELDALIEKARRKEMAAKAMQGILANPTGNQEPEGAEPESVIEIVVLVSTRFADALLAELERTDG
ncbi:hypothetical protein [Vreelandella titanicae]|uniref:hypothetical protein n=1 Tax=Vreelandella titanicae TaxID=664683 RepID=UPI0038103FAA